MSNLKRTCLLLVVAMVVVVVALGVDGAAGGGTAQNLTLPSAAAASPLAHPYDGKIVGGIDVAIKTFPYQLSLQVSGKHVCGATIISAKWALTAAHCIGAPVAAMTLRDGSAVREAGGTVHRVTKKTPHGKYDQVTNDYDIALLRVDPPFMFKDSVASIPLHAKDATIDAGTNTTVSGWGKTAEGDVTLPKQLQAVSVPIVSDAACKTAYGASAITDRMLCAGFTAGGKDSCQGDSGGPLVGMVGKVRTLVGVVSWGEGCAQPDKPTVYARVANLNAWIKTNSA